MDASSDLTDRARFDHPRYLVRAQLLRLFGGAFRIHDPRDRLVLYTEQKRFRLREDIRLYADEGMGRELLRIATQSVLDFSGAYDVHDAVSGEHVGTLKRRGLSSTFMRDHWDVLDAHGRVIGELTEDSSLKGVVRRFIDVAALLMPQRYHLEMGSRTVATYCQRFNPLVLRLEVDFGGDVHRALDRRLGLAVAVLLSAIEGRQG